MKQIKFTALHIPIYSVLVFTLISSALHAELEEKKAIHQDAGVSYPTTVSEARGRARWMHEAIRGALQVMHRDFFDDDEAHQIPSQSLEDVFAEMKRTWCVEIRWLGGNATKDIDHKPQDRFESRAIEALIAGEKEYELATERVFRYVGLVPLQNECLKSHVPRRTSLEDRVAGLAISFPIDLKGQSD